MYYYKKVKDGKVIAYLSQTNEVTSNDLISINENEYNAFIESIKHPETISFLKKKTNQ